MGIRAGYHVLSGKLVKFLYLHMICTGSPRQSSSRSAYHMQSCAKQPKLSELVQRRHRLPCSY
jgi:hypothetical protein